MNKFFLVIFAVFLSATAYCQSGDIQEMHENARQFMNKGDYVNATIILARLHQQAPFINEIGKDLAICYYAQGENDKALETIRPYLKQSPDEETYKITGMIYKKLNQPKDAIKNYKKALKTFPKSGQLYGDYGDLLWSQQDYSAIDQWENGIRVDPGYPDNYLNATRFYFATEDGIWPIIYAEIFINLEPNSTRTAEAKSILLDSYKKLFTQSDLPNKSKGKNKFENAYLLTLTKSESIITRGLNVETLTMIRTRFILDWYQSFANQYPFVLFDQQKYLLQNGLFEAYNHWLFGNPQNLDALKNWIRVHPAEYDSLIKYLNGRNFSIPEGQYYH